MRLQLELIPTQNIPYNKITNKHLQSLIYRLLNNTRYNYKHNQNGFKFFNYSNIFPINNYRAGYTKKLLISSSNKNLIDTIYHKTKTLDKIRLGNGEFILKKCKKLKQPRKYDEFKTGTPIVIYENREENKLFSFKEKPDINFFFQRLKENALKKYNAYYNKKYEPDGDIFVEYEFKREVAHSLYHRLGNYRFLIIGSQWNYLKANPEWDQDFYKFIYEVGLGEKNSLGYGFLNNY